MQASCSNSLSFPEKSLALLTQIHDDMKKYGNQSMEIRREQWEEKGSSKWKIPITYDLYWYGFFGDFLDFSFIKRNTLYLTFILHKYHNAIEKLHKIHGQRLIIAPFIIRPLFPFYLPENLRKLLVLRCFQGV